MPIPNKHLICNELSSVDLPSSNLKDGSLKAILLTSKLWSPGDSLNIFITQQGNIPWTEYGDHDYDPLEDEIRKMTDSVKIVQMVIEKRFSTIINLKFNFVTDPNNAQIRILVGGGQNVAHSYVGKDCLNIRPPQETMRLGFFDSATVIHEFSHALGMVHEHSNPVENPIIWNVKEIYRWADSNTDWTREMVDNNIIMRYSRNEINASQFDPYSIMLYFVPEEFIKPGGFSPTQRNSKLSILDMVYLRKVYHFNKSSTNSIEKFESSCDDDDFRKQVEAQSPGKTCEEVVAEQLTSTETVKDPSTSTETVKEPSTSTKTVKEPSTSTKTVKEPSTSTETVKEPSTSGKDTGYKVDDVQLQPVMVFIVGLLFVILTGLILIINPFKKSVQPDDTRTREHLTNLNTLGQTSSIRGDIDLNLGKTPPPSTTGPVEFIKPTKEPFSLLKNFPSSRPAGEVKTSEPPTGEVKTSDPPAGEVKTTEPPTGEVKTPEPPTGEVKTTEPEPPTGEVKTTEPLTGEVKKSETIITTV